MSSGLKQNFEEVAVAEVDCPDLTVAPFHLASSGICGSPTIVEIGGPPYLLPLVDRTKLYDLVKVSRKVLPNAKDIYLCGAGAGPHPTFNTNCEVSIDKFFFDWTLLMKKITLWSLQGIYNLKINENGSLVNESHVARVSADESCVAMKVPDAETKCALMANLLLSEGRSGKVNISWRQFFDQIQ